jgi:hypothetical protein
MCYFGPNLEDEAWNKANQPASTTILNTEHFWVEVQTMPNGDVRIFAGSLYNDATIEDELIVKDHFPSLFTKSGKKRTPEQMRKLRNR